MSQELPKSTLERYIRSGHPLSFDDPGFVRGTGLNDFPGGIPCGSTFQGVPCCGALNSYGVPCINKPEANGRCNKHQRLPTAYKHLSKHEIKEIDQVKVGDLQQEIKIFKTLLYRALEVYDQGDRDSVKTITDLVEQVRALEAEQFRLTGGTSNSDPATLAQAMREFNKNTSMTIEVRPAAPDAK